MAIFPGSAIPSAVSDDYEIDNSLRFNAADSAYLKIVNGTPTNEKIWTWSAWIKWGNFQDYETVVSSAKSGETRSGFIQLNRASKDGAIRFYCFDDSDTQYELVTDAVYRDPSAWYHVVCSCDSTDTTAADRMQVWVNGERQSVVVGTNGLLPVDTLMGINGPGFTQTVGTYDALTEQTAFVDGYIAEVYFTDGTRYDADSFGELDSATNQWIPKDAKDDLTFGTNGFYQKYGGTGTATNFEDSSSSDHSITRNGDTINARGADLDTTYSHIEPFTSTGSGTWTCPTGVTSADILIVAGAGGGGHTYGGGGGAGGIVHHSTYTVVPGVVYDLTVGAGGAGGTSGSTSGTAGSDSVFNVNAEGSGITMTASGGGGGASANSSSASAGGSGGGGSYGASHRTGGASDQGAVTGATVYGNDGGDGYFVADTDYCAGGGGGASAVGADGAANQCGNGGAGQLFSNFTSYGASGYFGGGGGGSGGSGYSDSPGSGGSGGGGAGGTNAETNNGTAGTANTGGGGGGGGDGGNGGSGVILIRYELTKPGISSIYFDGTGDSLELAASSDWDFGTGAYTVEGWIKSSDASSQFIWHGAGSANTDGFRVRIQGASDGLLNINEQEGGNDHQIRSTTRVDDGVWHHWAASRESGDPMKLFVDGVHEATQDANYNFDNNNVQLIGMKYGGNEPVDGYMDEIRVSNTARYTGNFTVQRTEFSSDANTKFLLHSDYDGGLGADSSGNFNNFTATNLVATDQMIDTPTNNFCTLNPLPGAGDSQVTWNQGNLMSTSASGTSNYNQMLGTFEVSSGKWYWECVWTVEVSGNDFRFFGGIIPSANINNPGEGWSESGVICYYWGEWAGTSQNGYKNINGTKTTYGATGGDGDIMGIALNCDDSEITFYKNNATQGAISFDATTTTPLLPYMPTLFENASGMSRLNVNFGADSSFAGTKTSGSAAAQDDNDQGDFYYEPPSGFLALCEANLPDPEIALPGDNFNTILYDDGAGAKTGVGFQPDLVWVKSRGSTYDHKLTDSVRGVTKAFSSNLVDPEVTDSTGLTAFGADGFTVGADTDYSDTTGTGMVAWNWKAGGAASTNEDGSQDSEVSANPTAGFSIVSFLAGAAPSGNMTVGHGLNQAPTMIIVKDRDRDYGSNVYQADICTDGEGRLILNSTDDYEPGALPFNGVPTSSVFTFNNGFGSTGDDDIIAYCFHSVGGYSKVGVYEGNGNADGPFIYTGFRPAMVIYKKYSANGNDWFILDNKRPAYNVVGGALYPNDSAAESTDTLLDFVSNGIKVRNSYASSNTNGADFIYIAFAESPFKYSNAR